MLAPLLAVVVREPLRGQFRSCLGISRITRAECLAPGGGPVLCQLANTGLDLAYAAGAAALTYLRHAGLDARRHS